MDTKHTPGPWEVTSMGIAEGVRTHIVIRQTPSGSVHNPVATALDAHPCGDPQTRDANARLIAAAPDLLEACQLALVDLAALCDTAGHDVTTTMSYDNIRAAIAKATQ